MHSANNMETTTHKQALVEIVDSIIAMATDCHHLLSKEAVGEVGIIGCKKNAIHIMDGLKSATHIVSTWLEETKEETITSKINAITYIIDDLYRRLDPRFKESLTACLRDQRIEEARSCAAGLKKEMNQLRELIDTLKEG